MKREVRIIINKSEITAGTRGASLGPEAIMAVARKNGKTFFGDYPIDWIEDVNYLLDRPIIFPHAKKIEGLVEIFGRVSTKIAEVIKNGEFPLVLASDHGSAGGTIAGIKKANPEARIGVIWIDAHGDIHTPYTTPSGNMHGMPLATALGKDNKECRKNFISEKEVELWDKLKNMAVPGAKVLPEDLVFIGVRDTEKEEDEIIGRLGIRNHTVKEIREKGALVVAQESLEQLKNCDSIYISFDVDSMDPEFTSHGTGTPVENGLTPDEAHIFLTTFTKDERLKCMEFVEVNPLLDEHKNKMAEVTFKLVEAVVEKLRIKN